MVRRDKPTVIILLRNTELTNSESEEKNDELVLKLEEKDSKIRFVDWKPDTEQKMEVTESQAVFWALEKPEHSC